MLRNISSRVGRLVFAGALAAAMTGSVVMAAGAATASPVDPPVVQSAARVPTDAPSIDRTVTIPAGTAVSHIGTGNGLQATIVRTATETEIVCKLNVQNPHNSSHVPGTVNVVATINCDGVVAYLDMWVSLFRDNTEVSYAHNSASVTSSLQANTAVSCVPGTYFGGATGAVTFPPTFVPPTSNFGGAVWSPDVAITC